MCELIPNRTEGMNNRDVSLGRRRWWNSMDGSRHAPFSATQTRHLAFVLVSYLTDL